MKALTFISVSFNCLFTKFYIFKGIAIACSLYLLYSELCVFFLEKPTSTSIENTQIQESFPKIFICPVVGVDQTELYANGYLLPWDYFYGNIMLDNHTGKNSETGDWERTLTF